MSQERQSAPPSVSEGQPQPPVTNLTLVVLLLIPCVVILLLLNCLFLGYKLLLLSKRGRPERDDTEELLLRSTLQRAARAPDAAFSPRGVYLSVSEPALPLPVTSSRASSRERAGFSGGMRLLRPDGATGSGSLRAPSSIRAASPAAGFAPRLGAPAGPPPLWCQSAPVLPQSSDSETETGVNLVPPNSPTQETARVGHIRRSSTFEALADVGPDVGVLVFDKVDTECETSCINTSAVASGLDSDFGASAGVSLRILSADSDGLSNGVLTSALEWDYYDPCYVRQNNVPRHKHHRPAIHTKQYWV